MCCSAEQRSGAFALISEKQVPGIWQGLKLTMFDYHGKIQGRRYWENEGSPEGERGPILVALSSVVEDDVQDDLDAALVACLHQRLELVDDLCAGAAGRRRRAVAPHGREEAHRGVSPVVEAVLVRHRNYLEREQRQRTSSESDMHKGHAK